jgi:hypothetical protein
MEFCELFPSVLFGVKASMIIFFILFRFGKKERALRPFHFCWQLFLLTTKFYFNSAILLTACICIVI